MEQVGDCYQGRDNELLIGDSRESRDCVISRCRLKGVKLYEGLKEKGGPTVKFWVSEN